MFNSQKAQTATEYMIILAVVIIIALIVVGVLGGIPGIGGGARARASASYWQTADIAIVAFKMVNGAGGAGAQSLKIRNNLRDTITINNVSLSTTGSGTVASFKEVNGSTVLAPGETDTISNDRTFDPCAAAGDSYTMNVYIKYTDDETGAVFEFTGDGNKLEGVCATS
jgi:hypothetical protein